LATIIMSVLVGGAPAHAQNDADYWLVRVSEDHTLFDFIDASTITYDGPFRSVWLTEIVAGKGVGKHDLRRKMIFTMFDCGRKYSREIRVVTYDRQGETLADRARDTVSFKPIIPESIDSIESQFVCANSDSWASRTGWTEIDGAPEKKADDDRKSFQVHQAR
jgi:hypothetical protein